jgi:hypothetical protein
MSPPGQTSAPACREASNRVWRQTAAESLSKAGIEPYGFRVRSLVATWIAQGLTPAEVATEAAIQRRGDVVVVRSKAHWPWRVSSA